MDASRVPEATLAEERRMPDALGFAAPPACKGQVSFPPPAGSSWPQQLGDKPGPCPGNAQVSVLS